MFIVVEELVSHFTIISENSLTYRRVNLGKVEKAETINKTKLTAKHYLTKPIYH